MGRVSSKVLASELGISDRQVRNLHTQGVLTTGSKDEKNHYSFDLETSVTEYKSFIDATDDANVDWNVERAKEDARMKRIKADMLQLELDEMRGRYHRSEFVEDAINDLVFAVRSHIIALPGKLGPAVAGISDVALCVDAIKRECNAVLEDLARYEYNPEHFRERLRDSGGMAVDDDD